MPRLDANTRHVVGHGPGVRVMWQCEKNDEHADGDDNNSNGVGGHGSPSATSTP
jgi:hypothetical protein